MGVYRSCPLIGILRGMAKAISVARRCRTPSATETEFFKRADMLDTKVGAEEKDDPAMVARKGFDAMIKGKGDIVIGIKNKVQSAVASVTPAEMLAKQHRKWSQVPQKLKHPPYDNSAATDNSKSSPAPTVRDLVMYRFTVRASPINVIPR